jgi:phosphoribosylamine--glycine ligase
MATDGIPFRGVLYAGLMLTKSGPKLIEYNVRFGDPEAQVLMMRLKDDIVTLMLAACDGTLDKVSVRWHAEPALAVVMATKGYPGDYPKGSEVGGLVAASKIEGVEIFHAGTKKDGDRLIASGGRVLNVAASAPTFAEARERVYRALDLVDWPEGFYRRDIGLSAGEPG